MADMKTYGILNGPNLDRLGKREPTIYGSQTLEDLRKSLELRAAKLGVAVECFQSNHEGALIDKLAAWADGGVAGVVLNGAAFTHTSVALRDAVTASGLPVVEVHISNVHSRESFRHHSFTAPVCVGVIAGLGFYGYEAALEYLVSREG